MADLGRGAGALRAARRDVDVTRRHDPGGCDGARLPVVDHLRYHPEMSSSPATSALPAFPIAPTFPIARGRR
jgi:hypothetical protein